MDFTQLCPCHVELGPQSKKDMAAVESGTIALVYASGRETVLARGRLMCEVAYSELATERVVVERLLIGIHDMFVDSVVLTIHIDYDPFNRDAGHWP